MTGPADNTPRIYVACLAAYKNSYLHAGYGGDQCRVEMAMVEHSGPSKKRPSFSRMIDSLSMAHFKLAWSGSHALTWTIRP
ncbi:hypothetical protein [Magnetospirillum fulvum]|uniref:Uncharacterized protein n=1 Tax=Magnetospirillum fulvum TaxID=1082 RepID=A0A1H6K243_MAGFU|nr:hypothetical protein [Magnetospirillum fulvum]SEH66380.1 hypothetical protein SAMN04244559_03352 [Magnetospirillum fulvum]